MELLMKKFLFLIFVIFIKIQSFAQNRNILNEMDHVLKRASSLQDFLNNPQLQKEYFLLLRVYMGSLPHFEESYYQVIDQVKEVSLQVPELNQLLWDSLPIELIQVPGLPEKIRIRSLPRRFHGIFKGLKAEEPAGGFLKEISLSADGQPILVSGLTPLRWANHLLEGSYFYHVENMTYKLDHQYDGFIQVIPGQIVGKNGIYGSFEFASSLMSEKINNHSLIINGINIDLWLKYFGQRMPKNMVGLVSSNFQLDISQSPDNSMSKFRQLSSSYIDGVSSNSAEDSIFHNFEVEFVRKLADLKHASETKYAGAFIWGQSMVLNASISQVAVENYQKKYLGVKDLTFLNLNPKPIRPLSFEQYLEILKSVKMKGREHGLVLRLISQIPKLNQNQIQLLQSSYRQGFISREAVLEIYNSESVSRISDSDYEFLKSLPSNLKQRFKSFQTVNVDHILKTKIIDDQLLMKIRLLDLYQQVFNLKNPIEIWLDGIKSIQHFRQILTFHSLNDQPEVALAALIALKELDKKNVQHHLDRKLMTIIDENLEKPLNHSMIKAMTHYVTYLNKNTDPALLKYLIVELLSQNSIPNDLTKEVEKYILRLEKTNEIYIINRAAA